MCGTGDRGAGETPSTTTTSAATRLHNVNSSNNSAVSSRMPASSSDDPVSNALHMSLLANKCSTLKCNSSSVSGENGVVTTLDNKLVASTKRVLLAEIAFEKCNSYSSTVLDSLKQRYIVLNTTTTNDSSKVVRCGGVSDETKKTKVSVTSSADDGLPKPKIVLYPADNVQLGWQGSAPVGAGMVNLRNTCYLNSTLQALFHVPAFVNWLMNDKSHVSKCSLLNGLTHSECLICAMKSVLIAHRSTNNAIKPLQIYSKLKLICKHFVHGQQEDAHEFLRYLIESMERSYLNVVGGLKLDSYSKETTPLNQIFGGYLRTEVTCLVCGHVSTTYQHFQDLPLDIRQVSSVEAALDTYFSREQLGAAVGGSNEEEAAPYKCDKCHRRVNATKKFSLQRAPNVLCLQLKRFGITGGKMSKHISLQMSLDITRHMHASTHSGGGSQRTQRYRYRLVSMISHIGPSSGCGHYTAMAAASSGQFYLFDDNLVRQMTVSNVLYNSNAYVIIYELEPTSSSFSASSSSSSSFSSSSSALSTLHQRSSSNCSRAPASPSSSSSGSSASGAKIVQNGSGGSGGDVTPSPSPTQSGGGKVLPLYIKPPCTTTTTTTPNSNHCATATTSVVAVAPKHERASSSSSSSTSTTTSASFATSFSSSCHSTPSSSSSSLSVQQQQRHHAITTTTTSSNSPLKQQQVSTAIKKLPCNGGVASLPPSPSSSTSPTKKRLVPYTTTESDSDSDESGGEQVVSSTSSSSSPFPRPPRSSTTELSKKLEIDCGSSTATTTPHPSSATNVWHVTEVTTSSQPQQQQHSSSSTASVSSSCSNNSSVGNWSVTDSSKKQPTRSTPGDGGNSRVGDRTNGGVPIGQLTEQHVLNSSSISSNKWNHSNGGCADRKGAGGGKMWDGSRADTETVGGLLKMSHRGYGGNANVSTWEGGRSELDQELDKDKINEQRKQKRNYYSSGNSGYDDELDRGKVKKMKYNSSSSSNIGNGGNCNQRYNPFQEHQNRKNNSWYNNNNKRPPFYHNNSLDRYRNGNRSNSNSYHRNSFNRWRH